MTDTSGPEERNGDEPNKEPAGTDATPAPENGKPLDMQDALENLYKSLEDVTLTDLPEDQRLKTVELRGKIYNQLQALQATPLAERDAAYAKLQADLGGAVKDLKALRDWLGGFRKEFAWAGRISAAITDVLPFL